jgi:hypothetical protein
MSKPKIVTKEVTTKNKESNGYKVYIEGEKFPKKPMDFYKGITEEQAITEALEEFRGKSTKSLQARRMAIVREMSTIVGGGGGGKP